MVWGLGRVPWFRSLSDSQEILGDRRSALEPPIDGVDLEAVILD